MKQKISAWAAFFGLAMVITGILSRFVHFLTVDQRTGSFIIGFALMLLGTIWKVVLEMNQDGTDH
ncbi:hypothetical protein [Roseivirga sp.]|uniref:hypothetical protein n=1 Tax=Roseivirga sp. TaxID=1964215 RepID=UPI003B525143